MHFIHHQYSCGGGGDRNWIENRAQLEAFGPKHARVRFSAHHAKLENENESKK
jgi:hypothetical protein